MKKEKGRFNFSDKLAYTLIATFAIIFLGIGVYALSPGVAPNPGHTIDSVAPPTGCTAGQTLSWTGSAWTCVDVANILFKTYISTVFTGTTSASASVSCNYAEGYFYPVGGGCGCPSGTIMQSFPTNSGSGYGGWACKCLLDSSHVNVAGVAVWVTCANQRPAGSF